MGLRYLQVIVSSLSRRGILLGTWGIPDRTKGGFGPFNYLKRAHLLVSNTLLPMSSNPLSRFAKLHLDDMAETRSQRQRGQHGQRGQRGPGRAPPSRGLGRGRASSQPVVPTITPVRGQSGALYNTQDLSPESNKRATEGLAADFYVDRLHSHENMDHSDAYYAFQLKKPVSVRIHDPAFGVNRVKCSCGGGEDPICCEHIYASTALQLNIVSC